jgi:hypothetical protein
MYICWAGQAPIDSEFDLRIGRKKSTPTCRRTQFFRGRSHIQFYPITPPMLQKVAVAEQINSVLAEWIKQRRITWEEVRTEIKFLATMVFAGSGRKGPLSSYKKGISPETSADRSQTTVSERQVSRTLDIAESTGYYSSVQDCQSKKPAGFPGRPIDDSTYSSRLLRSPASFLDDFKFNCSFFVIVPLRNPRML